MLDSYKIAQMTEEEINEIAYKYWKAKSVNDKNEIKNYMASLYMISINSSVLNRKMKKILASWGLYEKEATDEKIDYFNDMLRYFNWDKNNNFIAFMLGYLPKYEAKKKKKQLDEPIESIYKSSGDEDDEIEELGRDESYLKEEKLQYIRSRFPSLISNFYKHNSAKTATKARYDYFRVFSTEKIIEMIKESQNIRYFNKAEAYESTDKEFVRFIANTSYEKIDDILSMKFKNFSDVLEKYDQEDKEIDVPCDANIISEYFYKSGKSEKRPSGANISQFRTKYEEYFRTVWEQ